LKKATTIVEKHRNHRFVLTEHRTVTEATAGVDIPNTWCSRDLRAEIDAEHLGMADGDGES
jgi:hypothetical protein